MSRIQELPDDADDAMPIPDLPPHLADTPHQTVDEIVADLKKTPFFMTSLDDAGDEPNPELDAMRALLYEGTRGEVAANFREQGNEHARSKQWKDAKELYTKGLAALQQQRQAEDPVGEAEDAKERDIKEALLANRALSHLELQNYRSCILDCSACLELAPANVKAHYRMSAALFALAKLPSALTTASAGLELDPSNTALQTLVEKIRTKKAAQDAIDAKRRAREDLALKEKHALWTALQARKIKMRGTGRAPDLPDDAAVHLEKDKLSPASLLVFPVMLLYPLHAQSDFIKEFRESQTLSQHLEYLLPLPWDERGEYTTKGLEAYIETAEGGLLKWGKNVELLRVLSGGKIEVVDGIVRINVVPKSRAAEWIESLRKKKSS